MSSISAVTASPPVSKPATPPAKETAAVAKAPESDDGAKAVAAKAAAERAAAAKADAVTTTAVRAQAVKAAGPGKVLDIQA